MPKKVTSPGPTGLSLESLRSKLRTIASPEKAAGSQRYFKTGPGEYGEGDRFLGLTVPDVRAALPETDSLTEADILKLLASEWHEERLLALLIWVRRFERARTDENLRRRIVDLYLDRSRWVNNWDLVDSSAWPILGVWLLNRDRSILDRLAASKNLWEQRIAVVATFAFIRENDFADTLRLTERLLVHPHDLMHKACGWMLREVGKRDESVLRSFLDRFAPRMPRTMLRYAIEKFSEADRERYLLKRTRDGSDS